MTPNAAGALEIQASEFTLRQQALAKELRALDLAGCLVWSLGGSSFDWHGDVMYLTNHHAMMPHVAAPQIFTAAGFSAAVVTADGSTTLVTSVLDDPEDRVIADDVRATNRLPEAVAEVIANLGLANERLGLAGRETLLASHKAVLDERLSAVTFEPVDDVLERLRAIKSPAELNLLRHAVRCGVASMEAALNAAVPGVTEADYVAAGLGEFIRLGGVPYDVATAAGPRSKHYWGSAGVPHWNTTTPLQEGEILHCDIWGPVNGYYTDFARSTVVGRDPSPDQLRVLEGAIDLIETMTSAVSPGRPLGQIYEVGRNWYVEHGQIAADGNQTGANFLDMFPGFGHCIGLGIEAPWIVADQDWVIEPNMVLAIEAIVAEPGVGAANFEHNLIVTETGIEVLDASAPYRPWDKTAG